MVCLLTAPVKRRKKKTEAGKDESTDKSNRVESIPTEVFSIERLNSCQTNFSEKENYQKAVCFTPNGLFFVTGGTDGHVRLWSVSLSFNKRNNFGLGPGGQLPLGKRPNDVCFAVHSSLFVDMLGTLFNMWKCILKNRQSSQNCFSTVLLSFSFCCMCVKRK